mmetsp:Transcript_71189/g.192465  ORF Transcript_71189/g.192465 Transcript_71189/m.192465 type:complete len:368 (-) Transcript_71189:1660-2763(-)
MTVQVWRRADFTASRWDWFRCVSCLTSLRALSNLSESQPPGLSLATFAASFSLVSFISFSAASSAARLSSSVGPPLRHCFAQLSARPTLAVMSSSETRGLSFMHKLSSACSWRSYSVLFAPLSMRQRLDMASSGQQPLSLMTICDSSRPLDIRMSAMKPSPIFSSCSPLRICCLDSEIVTESPRLNFRRSNCTLGGSAKAPISLPGSSQPIMVTFLGSRRPNTPVQGKPSSVHPRRCSSPSGRRWVRRRICLSSSMCSKCISMQKCPKYSAAGTELSCVARRALRLLMFNLSSAACASRFRELLVTSAALPGSTTRSGSGILFLSRRTNQPPVGGPFVSRAFHARHGPLQSCRLIHQPLRSWLGSRR